MIPYPDPLSTKKDKNNVIDFNEALITRIINDIEDRTSCPGCEEPYDFEESKKTREAFNSIKFLGIYDEEIAYYIEKQIEHDLFGIGIHFEFTLLERKVFNAIYTSSKFYNDEHILSVNDICKIVHRKPPFVRKAIFGIEEALKGFFFIYGEYPTPNNAKCKFIILWEEMFNHFYSGGKR